MEPRVSIVKLEGRMIVKGTNLDLFTNIFTNMYSL